VLISLEKRLGSYQKLFKNFCFPELREMFAKKPDPKLDMTSSERTIFEVNV